jgi:hypothetical protein
MMARVDCVEGGQRVTRFVAHRKMTPAEPARRHPADNQHGKAIYGRKLDK